MLPDGIQETFILIFGINFFRFNQQITAIITEITGKTIPNSSI